MALNFPNNPNNGDVFTSDTKSWIYNSSKGIWISSTTGIGVIDDDTMLTASSDKLSTSESIKQYVDEHTHDEHILVINDDNSGYEISPRGLITQWGTTVQGTDNTGDPETTGIPVVFPKEFPNKCLTLVTGTINAPTNNPNMMTHGRLITTTGFKMVYDTTDSGNNPIQGSWIAIGY